MIQEFSDINNIVKIYAIKNIKTNKLVYNRIISNPTRKFFTRLGNAQNAMESYRNSYESRLKNPASSKQLFFLLDNPPSDLRIITFHLVEEARII